MTVQIKGRIKENTNKKIQFETKIIHDGKEFEGNKNQYYHINNNTQE